MFSLDCLDTLTAKRHLNIKSDIRLPPMNHTCASHCGNDVSLLLFYFFKDCKRCESVLWVMLQQKNTFTSKMGPLRKYKQTYNLHFNVLESKEAYLKKQQEQKKPWLTFDQPLVVQLAGQGMCVLQDDMDSGLGMCSQSLGRRAFCSSTLTAWMQRTVLLVCPELPQLAEHFCHSPTHQLTQRHTKWLWFNGPPEPQRRRQRTTKTKWLHSNGSATLRVFFAVLAVRAAICVFTVLIDLLVNSNVLFCFTKSSAWLNVADPTSHIFIFIFLQQQNSAHRCDYNRKFLFIS